MNINAKSHVKFAGRYKLILRNAAGEITKDTGWFDNLITNQGMDWIGAGAPTFIPPSANLVAYLCGVGTGSTTPAITDTRLTSITGVLAEDGGNFSSSTYVAGPPAYWSGISTYTFGVGVIVANIAEVGTGNADNSSQLPFQLFSHALILDIHGNPTTLTVTSHDQLTVIWELRMYLDLTDNTYSMVIGGVTYGGTYRRCDVTTVPKYRFCVFNVNGNGTPVLYFFNGSIGSVTAVTPSGSQSPFAQGYSGSTYTTGSYTLQFTSSFSLSQGNVSGGATAIMTVCSHGNYQFAVSPTFPKTTLSTCTITWSCSWARYP